MLRPRLLTSVLEFGHKLGRKVRGSEVRLSNYIVIRGQGERRGRGERLEKAEET